MYVLAPLTVKVAADPGHTVALFAVKVAEVAGIVTTTCMVLQPVASYTWTPTASTNSFINNVY